MTKVPSRELQDLIDDWAESYIKSTELPKKILDMANSEGLTKVEIRTLVETALQGRGLSDRRIREILPQELKDSSKVRPKPKQLAAESAAKPEETNIRFEDNVQVGSRNVIEKVKQVYEDIEEQDNESQDPNQVPDAVFTAKKLAKALDEINILNVKIEDKDKTIAQLQEAVKNDSFKTAADSMDEFHFDKIAVPMLMTELRKRQSSGWHFVRVKVEYVS